MQCLRSLRRVNADGLRIHIIVVDDGSSDGLSEALRTDFPEVEIYRGDGNLWFTGGANRGIETALEKKPDYVLLINNDTVFDAEFLQHLVRTAENNPRSIVGGLLLLWDTPHRVFQIAPQWDTWRGGWRQLQTQTVWTMPDAAFPVAGMSGNCVLFPVEVFSELGLMDEKRFPNYGDADLMPRARKKGWRLLVEPRARVFNQPNESPVINRRDWRQLYQTFWGDLRKQQNLRGHFYINWIGAPNKLAGVAATVAYVAGLLPKLAGFKTKPKNHNEKPLKEMLPPVR